MVMDTQFAGQIESRMAIENDIAFHTQEANAHFTGLIYGVIQQFKAIALALIVGMDADGAECPRRTVRAVVEDKFGLGKHDVAHDASVLLHHQIELGDEIGIAAVLVEHVMLGATRTIDVPESLTGKVLHLTVISGLF